jgi:hypothetical protein
MARKNHGASYLSHEIDHASAMMTATNVTIFNSR